MVQIRIEIDTNELIQANKPDPQPTQYLPTVPADYNTLEGLNNQKVWYKEYTKGGVKWIRAEGRGETPAECTDIIFRMSPGNTDTLIDESTGYHPDYGDVVYDDYPENMYVQAERLSQLKQIGYEPGDDNFTELIN